MGCFDENMKLVGVGQAVGLVNAAWAGFLRQTDEHNGLVCSETGCKQGPAGLNVNLTMEFVAHMTKAAFDRLGQSVGQQNLKGKSVYSFLERDGRAANRYHRVNENMFIPILACFVYRISYGTTRIRVWTAMIKNDRQARIHTFGPKSFRGANELNRDGVDENGV